MKKRILYCCFVWMLGTTAAALFPERLYAEPAPKERIVIDYFTRAMNVSPLHADFIRRSVVKGFLERGRHEVVDAKIMTELQTSNDTELIFNPLLLMQNMQNRMTARIDAIRSSDARYLISGAVQSTAFKRETVNGDKRFRCEYVFTLSGYDLSDNKMIGEKTFKLTGEGDSAEEADRRAFNSLDVQIEFYIDENYKFTTRILKIESPDSKGRLKELYLHCGTSFGVHKGDLFKVYVDTDMNGESVRKLVGKLRVKEVQGEDISRCLIVNGATDIAEAFVDGRRITVLSDGQAFF